MPCFYRCRYLVYYYITSIWISRSSESTRIHELSTATFKTTRILVFRRMKRSFELSQQTSVEHGHRLLRVATNLNDGVAFHLLSEGSSILV